jgi:LAS superfamily LD-carboxypeptidase LdcB
MTTEQQPVIDPDLLCGLKQDYLVDVTQLHCRLHPLVITPLLKLRDRASAAGFCLQVASSYRAFDRQLHIWNAKVSGQRPVLDNDGQPLDIRLMSERELLFAILRWSALPGASRHHWGTDLDVYDSSSISEDYVVQLTYEETCGEGPFANFHQWLTNEFASGEGHGFFRPYARDLGGVAPEPWHLSYEPIARHYAQQLTEDVLRVRLQATDVLLKPIILDNLSEIYQRFILASA